MSVTDTTIPLIVTQGDPDGVGPELIVRLAAEGLWGPADRVVADPRVLDRVVQQVDQPWAATGRAALADRIVPIEAMEAADAGHSQVAALARGVDLVTEHVGAALVTAPIDKHVCMAAGFSYPGHTEYLAARAQTGEFAMLMAGPVLRVALATIHVALVDVPRRLDGGAIVSVGSLLVHALRRDYGIDRPRVAVLGLNPHAGEGGVLGREEIDVIAPAVANLQQRHPEAVIGGPLPADTALPAHARGDWDGVLAMYHDQGLGPFKLLHFADGVNVTLGLPYVRTSPDHGTAKDIAGQGIADPSSMRAAVQQARKLARARRGRP